MIFLLLTVLLLTLIYFKIIRPYSYWTDRGVKQRKQVYLLGDNASIILKKETFWDAMKNLYDAFPEERYVGMYQMLLPTLLIRDPDLIKQITVKDFDYFVDHRSFVPEGADPLWGKNLISLKGNRWRDMRTTLSPSFTTSKMKAIFNLISDCAVEFNKHFLEKEGVTSVELKDICTRYTNDIIASVAFGIKCDSLKEPKNQFYLMGKEATNFVGLWKNLKFFAFMVVPQFCKLLGLTLFDNNVGTFFTRLVKDTITMREENGIVRPDMLHLLMEARKGRFKQEEKVEVIETGFATVQESKALSTRKFVKTELSDVEITAQALIFFFGGFESVATLMCFMGHELTINSDVQQKLYNEIDETLKECEGVLTYEALMKMKYLDMVLSETLRKWPTNIGTDRICVKPYTVQPVKHTEKPIHLKEGDVLWLPINGLHWDPQYFPNPEVFDPERFSDENKNNIRPYTYIPFGSGPRNCIGSRFALLETKVIFFHLLSNFKFVVVDKTQVPLQLSKNSFMIIPEKGFWIGLKPRIAKNYWLEPYYSYLNYNNLMESRT